jgi:hypothetical protein
MVSGVAGFFSKTVSPVSRSATAIETPALVAGGRKAALSRYERSVGGVFAVRERAASGDTARRRTAAWSAATRRNLRGALVTLKL